MYRFNFLGSAASSVVETLGGLRHLRGRLLGEMALVLSALVFTGCATMHVSSYVERGTRLEQYATYNWDLAEPEATGDARLDSNPFFHERVEADIEKQLGRRGFEKTWETPDLLLHYHASMKQRIDVNGIDRERGYCNADECKPFVYEAGTLLLDIVDARTNKIVWRGWVEDGIDLSGIIDNQRLMEARIDETVARLIDRLPPRL
jgi:hypothetical protein